MCVGADLGIVFDTDVDRSAIVDGDGTPINSNRFIALMAAIVLQVSFRRLPGSLYIIAQDPCKARDVCSAQP